MDALENFKVSHHELADELFLARRRARLSQRELGKLIGASQTAVNRYETGSKVPFEAAVRWSIVTGADLQHLVDTALSSWEGLEAARLLALDGVRSFSGKATAVQHNALSAAA